MSKILKIVLSLAVLILPLTASVQTEEERILSFHSDIEVKQDASLLVTETIRVVSTGTEIRRGIYRDFPIAYKDNLGRRYYVTFDLLDVERNGQDEPYHTQRGGNGIRIYIGQEDVFIPSGEHEYKITYQTKRQLGFFEDHDELYWNVTGNGWVFPIEKASAVVKLPGNISKEQITTTLFTGQQGSTAKDGTSDIENGRVTFETLNTLSSYEGLTIVVEFPKGIVTPPTTAENLAATLKANLDYIVGIFGLVLVFVYYYYMWHKRGRDPKKGTVIPQYEPPQGFSPAVLRYIRSMGSDKKAFAAAIINLGVKGKVSLTEKKGFFRSTTYTITKKEGSSTNLSPEEQLLMEEFFKSGDSFELSKDKAVTISNLFSDFSESLKTQVGKKYFIKNTGALVFGIFISILVVVGTIITAASVRFGVDSFLQILIWPVLIATLLCLNIVFGRLLRAYTVEGRKFVDEIEGFKWFLKVTEKDRLNFHNPPEKTPELFEKMLPFALALGVEHEWAKQFSDVFAKLEQQGVRYSPVWYHGNISHFTPSAFASSVSSSFTGVVSSAATPPGSSSGSGGGSGGGGGGGGGGGW